MQKGEDRALGTIFVDLLIDLWYIKYVGRLESRLLFLVE